MQKYFSFSGLSTRSEYWGILIISTIVFAIIATIGLALVALGGGVAVAGGMAVIISIIAYLWIYLSVIIRRCRDAGISPWWTAAVILPYISVIAIIVFGCIASCPTSPKD